MVFDVQKIQYDMPNSCIKLNVNNIHDKQENGE